jgi:hypothetical protein
MFDCNIVPTKKQKLKTQKKNTMKKLSLKVLAALSVFTLLLSISSCSNDEQPTPTINAVENLQETVVAASPAENTARLLDAGTYSIKRYVFVKTSGASGLGHVGVGVEIRTTNPTTVRYYNGSVENGKSSFIILPGGFNDGWYRINTDYNGMLNNFTTRGYNYLKFTQTFTNVTKQRALNTVNEIMYLPNRGYSLAGNNCINAVYDVLNQGGGLFVYPPTANPVTYAPNIWFNALYTSNGWSNQYAM